MFDYLEGLESVLIDIHLMLCASIDDAKDVRAAVTCS